MSHFLNLSPQKSIGLHDGIYKNARKLRKDAVLLAMKNKSYSTATSLLILSSEEVIKAVLVQLHSEGYHTYRMENAKKFFSDHKMRHQLAKFIEMCAGTLESIAKYEEGSVKLIKTKNDFFNSLINGILEIAIASTPLIESSKRVEDLENFNSYKNKGFYVDYFNGILLPHELITEVEFNRTKEIVDRIFKVYKGLIILFHIQVERRFDSTQIKLIKSQLKELINDALSDFSFNNKS